MNKKGLSLLEILIASLILALVITGLISVFVSGKRLLLHSRSRMAGGELGKFFLDPLENEVRQDLWGGTCLSNDAFCGIQPPETLGPITYTADYNTSAVAVPVPTNPPLRRATVTITWPRE